MESADQVRQELTGQGALLNQHEQSLRLLMENSHVMATQVSELTRQVSVFAATVKSSLASEPRTPTAPRETHVSDPEPFSGDLDLCRGFLLQCQLIFAQRPVSFASELSKIHYVLGLLRGKALAWAEAMSSVKFESLSFKDFEGRFREVFDHPSREGDAASRLMRLKQGNRTVSDYAVDFWTLAADSRWNDPALIAVFTNGLNDQIKDELAARDDPSDLHKLVSLAIKLDNRLRERQREKFPRFSVSATKSAHRSPPLPARLEQFSGPRFQPPARAPEEEPMQLGRTKLTEQERRRRFQAGECMYCSQKGHFRSACPVRPKGPARQ